MPCSTATGTRSKDPRVEARLRLWRWLITVGSRRYILEGYSSFVKLLSTYVLTETKVEVPLPS